MSLLTLFDTEVAIWRAVLTTGPIGEEVRTYERVLAPPGTPNAIINRPTAPIGAVGPGIEPVGIERLYMAPTTDVRPRDIIELVAGPDAPRLLEVDEPLTRPRGHHVEINTRLWNGRLPVS